MIESLSSSFLYQEIKLEILNSIRNTLAFSKEGYFEREEDQRLAGKISFQCATEISRAGGFKLLEEIF